MAFWRQQEECLAVGTSGAHPTACQIKQLALRSCLGEQFLVAWNSIIRDKLGASYVLVLVLFSCTGGVLLGLALQPPYAIGLHCPAMCTDSNASFNMLLEPLSAGLWKVFNLNLTPYLAQSRGQVAHMHTS